MSGWRHWLWLALVRPPYQPADLHAWLARYFPQLEPRRLRWGDPLRVLIQATWLLWVIPPGQRPPSPWPHWRNQARQLGRWLRRVWIKQRERHWDHGAAQRLGQALDAGHAHPWLKKTWVHRLGGTLALGLLALVVSTPFDLAAQASFVGLVGLCAWLAMRTPGPVATFVLIVLSLTLSTRYLWWRITDTLNLDSPFAAAVSLGLLLAEGYAWLILLLGFFQSSWLLQRKPAPLPADSAQWPHVDIFVPTYNEPVKVLRPTLYAALGLDWPKDKLTIWILDDGRRDIMREFAEEIGVRYLIRPDNAHAKAGNINHALRHAQGEYVAIFDCDHIPVRSFLQTTLGELLADPKLALVQTPHHFFSPDPFERNLGTHHRMPNEGELFYGRVQDGNDLWNATFFCGSCAVLRRTALDEIGGIAVETVTEDAHTALKMHRRGWRSAYLKLPQAAGLATESLSAHIGQRIRWARGMAQIFRRDNPLLGRGLSLAQRLCYSNAMLHFLYGIPRLVFLTAPLAYLLFSVVTIQASATLLLLYALPHIVLATATNSRLNGNVRRSFWGEVYETVLAWYITLPTTVALLAPGLGKFNVTAKGGLVEEDYFDWGISRPYLLLLGLNWIGVLVGLGRMLAGHGDAATLLVNMGWTLYNMLLLGVALAVANETRQVRQSHRVPASLPVSLGLADGRRLAVTLRDYSEGGMSFMLPGGLSLPLGETLSVSISASARAQALPAKVVMSRPGLVGVAFSELSREQHIALVQCTFARADAWLNPPMRKADHPLTELADIIRLGLAGQRQLLAALRGRALTPLELSPDRHRGLLSFLPRHPLPPPSARDLP